MGFRRLASCVVVSLGVVLGAGTTVRADSADPSELVFARKLSRWLDVQTFQLSARFRFVDADTPGPTSDQMQAREGLAVRLRADKAGRVAVSLGALTGPTFVGSWNDTGVGTGQQRFHASLRHVSLDLTPIKGVTAQIGSLNFARGESTEITTYDNDGYVVGERLTLRRPKQLFFDEIAVSRGFVGDTTRPSVFDRTDRFADFNYQQYLVARRVAPRVWGSTDFTRLAHANIVHAAARVKAPELRVADLVRYEQYVRSDHGTVAGFAVSGEKQVTKKLAVAIGYADIDRNYGGLNADRFNRGRRWFSTTTYALSPVFSIATYLTHAVSHDYTVNNRTRLDVILHYNVLAHLQQAGILR